MNQGRHIQFHEALPERTRQWLRGRGISDETIDRFHIGWDGRAITIPIFNEQGRFAFFKYRRDPDSQDSEAPKYWCDRGSSPELYGWEHIRGGTSPLIICAGELDRLVLVSPRVSPRARTGAGGGSV